MGRAALPLMSAAVCLLLIALFGPIAVHSIDGVPRGVDCDILLTAARRWLDTGVFYDPVQLAGAYTLFHGDILYPPTSLLLYVPFTVLPAFLWWAIPAGAFAWAMSRLRPHPMAWPVMTILALFSPAIVTTWAGNPVMWIVAALALGLVVTGPTVLIFLKPSLFPFALIGVNRRRWWIALGLLALVSLPFGLMWLDWVRVILNSNGSLGYSVREALVLAIPLVAWASRRPDPALAVMAG